MPQVGRVGVAAPKGQEIHRLEDEGQVTGSGLPGETYLSAASMCNVSMVISLTKSMERVTHWTGDCILHEYLSNLICYHLIFVSPPRGAGQQIQSRLIECPPPRKSLVKGERFIRSEGRPEWNDHFLSGTTSYTISSCVVLVVSFNYLTTLILINYHFLCVYCSHINTFSRVSARRFPRS